MSGLTPQEHSAWTALEYPKGYAHFVDDGVTAVAETAELFTGNRYAGHELSIRLIVGAVITDLERKGRLVPSEPVEEEDE